MEPKKNKKEDKRKMLRSSLTILHRGRSQATALSAAASAATKRSPSAQRQRQRAYSYTEADRLRKRDYYLRYRDLTLTCLREVKWCTDKIGELDRRLRALPAAAAALEGAAADAQKVAGGAAAKTAVFSERLTAAKEALSSKSSSITKLCAKNANATDFKRIDNILTLTSTSPARREYLALRRSIAHSKWRVQLHSSAVAESSAAKAAADTNAAMLLHEVKTVQRATGGSASASSAVARALARRRAAVARSIGGNALREREREFRRMLAPASHGGFARLLETHVSTSDDTKNALSPWETAVLREIKRYRSFIAAVRANQLTFKEEYKQLVADNEYGKAETLLRQRYFAVMAARAEEAELAALAKEGGATAASPKADDSSTSPASSFLAGAGFGFMMEPITVTYPKMSPAARRAALAHRRRTAVAAGASGAGLSHVGFTAAEGSHRSSSTSSARHTSIIYTPEQALRVPIAAIQRVVAKKRAARLAAQREAAKAAKEKAQRK